MLPFIIDSGLQNPRSLILALFIVSSCFTLLKGLLNYHGHMTAKA